MKVSKVEKLSRHTTEKLQKELPVGQNILESEELDTEKYFKTGWILLDSQRLKYNTFYVDISGPWSQLSYKCAKPQNLIGKRYLRSNENLSRKFMDIDECVCCW